MPPPSLRTRGENRRMSTTVPSPRRAGQNSPEPTPAPVPNPLLEPTADWSAWIAHLKQRSEPKRLRKLFGKSKASPLTWGVNLSADGSTLRALQILSLYKHKQSDPASAIAATTFWRQTLADEPACAELGLSALAWSQALPPLAAILSPEAWQGLLGDLIKLASEAGALQPTDDPLAHQLLAVELPFSLAYQFPELDACRQLLGPARKLFAFAVEEVTDGEGLLRSEHSSQMLPLLACWTRVITIARAMPEQGVDEDVQVQFEWLFRQTMRLLRPGGRVCLGSRVARDDVPEIVAAALKLIDDPEDHQLAKAALRGVAAKKPTKSGRKRKAKLPESHLYSEWSAVGLLRGTWELDAPRLAVAFGEKAHRCELFANDHLLLAGIWTPEVTIDGWKWRATGEWSEVCWHTDDDVVYLELETRLAEGWKLQRQMMLGVSDRVLLLADAVLGETTANIEYRSVLPLAPDIRFLPATETREGYLAAKRVQALVMPLALPEWRSVGGPGELTAVEGGLELKQACSGQRLFAPLWIDMSPTRIRKECTWRQLVVAEQLEILPPAVAVAYRVQVGKEQWTAYRSLAAKGNRTFLGQNIVTECAISRFKSDGTAELLLEIE